MKKKLSKKTSFILIGIVVGLFIGVSIKQAFGGTDTATVDQRNGNLAVNIANVYQNGLLVPYGNVGIGVVNPAVKLDVAGDIRSSTKVCIGVTCINEAQLQALLAGGSVSSATPIDETALCSRASSPFSGGTVDGVKPFVCSGKNMRSALGEYIYELLGENYLPYLHKTEHDECVATSPLPNQLRIVSSPNGCKLQGVVYESGKFSFMVSNEFGSATGDYSIVGYTPPVTLSFPSVCAGVNCKICPDAKVGEPFSCTLRVGTTGDWTGKKISFSINWGVGGNPGDLGLWDIYNNGVETITTPEPTDAQKSALISGTPTKAGTYQLLFCAGNGTEAHAAFCLDHYAPFIVKP